MNAQASQSSRQLIPLARVAGAYGIRGEVRVVPFSADAATLKSVHTWHLRQLGHLKKSADVPWRSFTVQMCKSHRSELIAQFENCTDRDVAEALKGCEIAVAREDFPALPKGEFYWVDLIGLDVKNLTGAALGQVSELSETASNPLLHVAFSQANGKLAERLIPFVDAYVHSVDLTAKHILVDWQASWDEDQNDAEELNRGAKQDAD